MPTPSNDLNISESGYVTFDGVATFHGRTFQAGTGIALTNADGTAGNTTISSTASLTDLHTARFIVASSTAGTGANFTSIQSAIDAAQGIGVNATVFIQPGTYTENLTLRVGVNLAAFDCDAFTPNVTIVGNATLSSAGTVSISGIRLQTNSAAFLTVSGIAASIVNLKNCYLNASNATGISFSSSSASATINISGCSGNLGTTGIKLYTSTSAGTINFIACFLTNTGASSTASDNSAGLVSIFNSVFLLSVSGTLGIGNSTIDTSAVNATSVTGTANIFNCYLASGTASAISSTVQIVLYNCNVNSTNGNAFTGAGIVKYSAISFTGTGIAVNTTTQSAVGSIQGLVSHAPTAGYLGESISGTGSAVSLSNVTAANVTSVNLTPGNWLLVGSIFFLPSGNSTIFLSQITSTSATISGVAGINYANDTRPAAVQAPTIPAVDQYVSITANTTYYLVASCSFAGSCATNGNLTAVRVG